MKKIALNLCAICLTLAIFTSCGSTRKGCGLTSDATKIETSTDIEYESIVVAE